MSKIYNYFVFLHPPTVCCRTFLHGSSILHKGRRQSWLLQPGHGSQSSALCWSWCCEESVEKEAGWDFHRCFLLLELINILGSPNPSRTRISESQKWGKDFSHHLIHSPVSRQDMSHVMDIAILCPPAAEILQPLLSICSCALLSLSLEQFPEVWPESPLLPFKAITFVLATTDKKNKSFPPSLQ